MASKLHVSSASPKREVMTALSINDCVNETCPWSGEPVSADSLTTYRGEVVGFCNTGCRDKFEKAVSAFDQMIDGSEPHHGR